MYVEALKMDRVNEILEGIKFLEDEENNHE